MTIPKSGLRFGLKIEKTTILEVSDRQIFFFVKNKLVVVFFGVKFTGNYYAVAVIP